jgi:hypothetical protein
MKKTMPNKATFTMGSTGGDKTPSIQKVQSGKDLRSKPCANAGKGKQND